MSKSTFLTGVSELAGEFDCFLIDEVGVMHDGDRPYPGAIEAMTRLTGSNKSVIVLTNSGRRAAPNMAGLGAIGFPRSSYTALVSSGEVTWQALRTGAFGRPYEAGGRVCVLGRGSEDYGLGGLDLIETDAPEAADFIVIAGSDCPRTSLDRYSDRLATAAARHVPALCLNPDRLMLSRDGLQPAAGAIAQVYETLGGRVTYIGKPFAAIYREAAKVAGSDAGRVLCIGDSLDRDVAGGERAGFRTALVRTGILADTDDVALRASLEAAFHHPTYVLPALRWT